MAREPQVGDQVSHEGHVAGYNITSLTQRFNPETGAPLVVAVFETAGYAVACDAAELVWLDEDAAWHLPGRLLSGEERDLWAKHYGGAARNRPDPALHVAARATLRTAHAEDHDAILQRQAHERTRHTWAVAERQELRRLRGLVGRLSATDAGPAIHSSLSVTLTERGTSGIYFGILQGDDLRAQLAPTYLGSKIWEVFGDGTNVLTSTARQVAVVRRP